jgi:tetratricopeptide (TPR) repeat protein
MSYIPSVAEEESSAEISKTYNSGESALAVEMAKEFLKIYPESILAQFNFAALHGDYSYSPIHNQEESQRLLLIAKHGISELFHHPSLLHWPDKLRRNIQNEYYWFFELHEEQYNHGQNLLKEGISGHYSSCVGASMMALKELRSKNFETTQIWAERAIKNFKEFQQLNPTWYNINYFAAQAHACLGKYEVAMSCFKKMYQKQNKSEKPDEIKEFSKLIKEIVLLRAST